MSLVVLNESGFNSDLEYFYNLTILFISDCKLTEVNACIF